MDPYDEFTSDYVGMGNDPVNMVDPSGGLSMSAIGDVLSQVACPTWGNGLTQLLTTAAKIGSMGSMLNMLTQMHTRTLQAELIAGQLMANVVTQAGDGKGDLEYWILYDGTQVNVYTGEYGNTEASNLVASFKGTSGIYTTSDPEGMNIANDYRNAKYQFTQKEVSEDGTIQKIYVGPIPEGDYSIDISLDPDRQVKIASNGKTLPGRGLEKLTYFKNGKEYVRYPAWGSIRARLEADPKTKLRGRDGNFYFHNSHKGHTHGCVETETGLFTILKFIRKSQSSIRVMIKYSSKNTTTNGNTGY